MSLDESRNEVQETLEKYGFFSGGPLQAFAKDSDIKKLLWFLQNGTLKSFEKPDAYIKVENHILIIEHFSIDGYTVYPKGGSELQHNIKMMDKDFEKCSRGKQFARQTFQIGTVNSYQGLINNCKTGFCNHYRKIQSYKNELIRKNVADANSDYTVCFLIEDVSPLGTLTYDGEKICPVALVYSKEFLDFYSNMKEVDWIISAVPKDYFGYVPYFLAHSYIPQCQKNVLDYANYQFLAANCMRTDIMTTLETPSQE